MNLQEIIAQKGLTKYKVAKQAKIGQATISELVSGKRKEPKYSTALKLAKILDVKVEKIYEAIKEGQDENKKRNNRW
ncbi:MAG: helix-turn-helix transcriptional regulator [Clostridium thermopalmarium]|uniref:helix-turn-helix domain-containing protein n=1 Tax=Clostridium thermopalmarium TaxID=29373 RepID=UPI00235670BC|nr:helix-turn-helix transcriptional regulator [Clostridium thermopalmarium]MBE6044100.1 helix-turn-helix transcriptional regulator [Clostridium thermopalmarium]